jgi:hypothetical protein
MRLYLSTTDLTFQPFAPFRVLKKLPEYLTLDEVFEIYNFGNFKTTDGEELSLKQVLRLMEPLETQSNNQPIQRYIGK